ncbi:MAG TPA: hypothetical protein VJV79_12825 [Polyangiaceae bacterium]|nr:hypothetical protein [Polyangiaceae bacterium]
MWRLQQLKRFANRAPFTWPRKRKIRWLLAIALGLLAYPVLVTLALWSGFAEWMLKSEDLRVEIQNPAYTIWPGKVHMKNVRILANGATQFILEGQDLVLNLRLLELVKRRVHVTQLAAHDVRYQMRVQVKDTKNIERRVKAYPPLADLPGANVVREPTAKQTEKSEADWTVNVEGLDISVKELWFFEYRYLGKGHLRGGFLVGPNVMQVETAVQDLGPGELRFGANETIATGLQGQISADIPRLNPKEHADASFMELVTARVNLRAKIESMASVGSYFEAERLEISKGKGPLDVDLYLDRGKLGSKSHLYYQTDSINLKGIGYGVGTDWQLDFDAAGTSEQLPLVRSSSKSSYVSLAREMRAFTIQIHNHHEEAQLDTIQLSKSTDLKRALLRMPQIVSVDLRDLPGVLADAPAFEMKGELHASLNLDMDQEYWTEGKLHAATKNLHVAGVGVAADANIKLDSDLRFNPKLKINRLQNLVFRMRDMDLRAGDRGVSGWWMDVESARFTLWNETPLAFDGTLGIQTRDLDPVLKTLAEKDVISELIPLFTSLRAFRASARVRGAGAMTDITLASESQIWDAAGRVFKNGDKTRMAIVVGGQAVSLGIASTGDGLELMPFAKTGWLNEHLREFPNPVLTMRSDKP